MIEPSHLRCPQVTRTGPRVPEQDSISEAYTENYTKSKIIPVGFDSLDPIRFSYKPIYFKVNI